MSEADKESNISGAGRACSQLSGTTWVILGDLLAYIPVCN